MSPGDERVALVTGAGSGIGRAIALALAAGRARVLGVGRGQDALEETARSVGPDTGSVECHAADLALDDAVTALATRVDHEFGRLDVLVHSAGGYHAGPLEATGVEALDELYRINLRVPFLLTRLLLPMLARSRGQVVLVNSSAGLTAQAGISAYAATKHALRGFADSLRAELNPKGVRVLSVYPGRTASPMQRRVHEIEGRPYRPDALLQPEDVASSVLHALDLPETAELTEIHIRPMTPLA